MQKKSILENEGLLFVNPELSRTRSGIHTLFMKFDLAIIWLDDLLKVSQVATARKGSAWILPEKPARYILETHPDHIRNFSIGDKLHFEEIL